MATSGSRDWIVTRNDIIKAALRKIGVIPAGGVPSPDQFTDASFALNSMVQSWQNDDVYLWTVAEEWVKLVDGTASYALGTGTAIEALNPIFRRDDSDTPLNPLTREEFYAVPDKKTEADPISVYVDYQLSYPTMWVWPVPSISTSVVVGTDALNYLCIKDHTSAAANKPVTGADYATYWQAVSTAGAVWGSGTSYHSDVIRYTKVLKFQDFDTASNNPDFPVRWTQALIYGLAYDISQEYGIPGEEKARIRDWFRFEYKRALKMNNDATDLRLIPVRG
jgi:hypothetical protein